MEKKEGIKARAPNFSQQECHLLAEIMGENASGWDLSRHKLDKHRYTDRITSSTKRSLWKEVESKFNASSVNEKRSSSELQKKWENLVSKHRAIYSDYVRDVNSTGGGPSACTKYSLLTEAIISVIGKDSVAVCGVGGVMFDSTINQLNKSAGNKQNESYKRKLEETQETRKLEEAPETAKISETKKCKGCCHCDEELLELKKKKVKLQIAYLRKKLGLNCEQ